MMHSTSLITFFVLFFSSSSSFKVTRGIRRLTTSSTRISPSLNAFWDKKDASNEAATVVSQTEVGAEVAKEPNAFEQVASKGLAGVLAITFAEAIFWALGMPLATLWVKYTTGEWLDLATQEGQLQAAGFTFGYGGFATVILQYRVTLFAVPFVPIMEKYVVEPGKKIFGEKFGQKET